MEKLNYSTLIGCWSTWLWNFSFRMMIPVFLPIIKTSMKLSGTTAGLLIGVLSIGYAISSWPAAIVSKVVGRKKIILIGIILSVGAMFLFSSAKSTELMLTSLFLAGLGFGSYLPIGISIISESYPDHKRGMIIGTHETAAPIGQVIGPVFAGIFITILSWAGCVQVWLIFGLFCLFLITAVKDLGQANKVANLGLLRREKPPTWNKLQMILVIMTYVCLASYIGVFSMLPLYLANSFYLDPPFVAVLLGFTRAPGIFGQLAFGRLSDSFGRLRILLWTVLIVDIATLGIAYLPYGIPFLITLLAYSASTQGFFPVILAMTSDNTAPKERTARLGMIVTMGGLLGSGLTPIIMGYLSDSYGFSMAFTYAVALSFIGFVSIVALKSTYSRTSRLDD